VQLLCIAPTEKQQMGYYHLPAYWQLRYKQTFSYLKAILFSHKGCFAKSFFLNLRPVIDQSQALNYQCLLTSITGFWSP
jgi:hypothetical protein